MNRYDNMRIKGKLTKIGKTK